MNAVSATTLIVTSTALTLALSLVPIISSQVTSKAMISAGRLMKPARRAAKRERPGGEIGGQGYPERVVQDRAGEIARPADRHRRGGDGIFEDQRPADRPGEKFAHGRIAVGVGGAGDGDHRGDFGVAKRGDDAHRAGDDEGQHQARTGLLRAGGGEHENARADDAADAEQGQLERAQRPVKRFLLGCRQNGIEWLYAPEYHVRPLGLS